MKVTVLGCGASAGVPLIGCECLTCSSDSLKNKRTRASILIESDTTRILIDTSPDLRQQALANGFNSVDAILYTHAHADHMHGIDDIRSLNYNLGASIPAYANAATMSYLQNSFAYVFQAPKPEFGWFRPSMTANVIEAGKQITIGDIDIMPFNQSHGKIYSLGFRVGNFVYSTDVKAFPPESEQYLQGLDIWLLDCLTDQRPMPSHAHLELSLQWVENYKPKHTVLTHLSHSLEYDALNKATPRNVEAAYDGMVLLS